MALICAPAIFLSDFGLTIWISPEFSVQARAVAQTILLGVWINGVAYVPFCLLQGQGRVALTAKFHMLEFLPFVGLLYIFLQMFGLVGAAYAWALRVSLDAMLLLGATTFRRKAFRSLLPNGIIMLSAWGITVWLEPKPRLSFALALMFSVLIGGLLLFRLSRFRAQRVLPA
jgi:O-antigen/teichoic acid export membrane protein